jgi:hypothetical protein
MEYNAESNAAFKAALRRIFIPSPIKQAAPYGCPEGKTGLAGLLFRGFTWAALRSCEDRIFI